ncbi:RibD family protein [Longispora albida]|uniref:RibD family protein n=1 Tax=Longispora albida TaxID=203523 RepID=UPI0003792DCD|nr:dihydrofolate reductase family protein [Longispora albida]
MTDRPYVLLSCAMSIDGHIDDNTGERLLLSNAEDFDRVDAVRATCDAILVGANTIRRDNPRLLVRSAERRAARVRDGKPESPVKVTISASGNLDPASNFFASGNTGKLVYSGRPVPALEGVATVVETIELPRILTDLAGRGVERLMVEGGSTLHTQFLTQGLADEVHLVVAPFFVGDDDAPTFVNPGRYPASRMRLAGVEQLGDCALLRYLVR